MTTTAVIPARYGSSRFPGKPLAKDTGKYLIQHVYESVSACSMIDRVIVATDDDRIRYAVASFGGDACMTRADHRSGTDRVGEVVDSLGLGANDLILNVQGDEPEISPDVLGQLIEKMRSIGDDIGIGTLATPFPEDGPMEGPGSPTDPSCVKVVLGEGSRAMYFSRSLIPFPRETGGVVDKPSRWLLHLGVYAFRGDVLTALTRGDAGRPTRLEAVESLEQLRWLEMGRAIAVEVVDHRAFGIDTPEDYAAFVRRVAGGVGVDS